MNRIPVTHAGSLIRPPELLSFLAAEQRGQARDSVYEAALGKAVADVVRRQVDAGVDIVDDGEMGKPNWITVEHPELVAQRLVRLASVVGPERVQAGTDCGFAQGAFVRRVHEEIQWAKLSSLAEGDAARVQPTAGGSSLIMMIYVGGNNSAQI